MEQIKPGQWWETKVGKRIYILADANIPGVRPRNANIIAIGQEGHIETYRKDGQYYKDQASSSALTMLLPPECNSFDWKPEPKWRDARPEDLTYPFKEARFRDNGSDWTLGQFAGYFPSLSYPWTNKTGAGWKHCQVKDE